MNPEEFRKMLAEQTAKPKESIDSAIMRIINSWRKNETVAFTSFRNKGKSDAEYLANQFAKARIEKEAAWEFVKKEIGPYYDISRQDELKAEFDTEFDKTMCDDAWRERVFKNVL